MKRYAVCLIFVLVCVAVPLALHPLSALAQNAAPDTLPDQSPDRQGQLPSFSIQTLAIPNLPSYDLKVSPDGRLAALFVGQMSQMLLDLPVYEYVVDASLLPIRLLDLTTGTELPPLTGQTDYASDVAFSPDGTQLASYHQNGDIIVWDIASGQPVQQITAILTRAKLEFTPDGKTLITYFEATSVGHFLMWDLETASITKIWRTSFQSLGNLTPSTPPGSFDNRYTLFSLSPDGTHLATATANGEVMLWDLATLQQTVLQPKASDDQMLQFNVRGITFTLDSQTLIYFDELSEQTHVWDVASGTETATLAVGGSSFALSPQQDLLAWATREELWLTDVNQPDSATSVLVFADGLIGTLPSGLPSVAFSSDGSRMVVGGFYSPETPEENTLYVITFD